MKFVEKRLTTFFIFGIIKQFCKEGDYIMRKKVIKNLKVYMKSHYLCEMKPKLHKAQLAIYMGVISSFMMSGVMNPVVVEADDEIIEQVIDPMGDNLEDFTDEISSRMIQQHKDYNIGEKDYEAYIRSLSNHYHVNTNDIRSLLNETMEYLLVQENFEKAVQFVIEYNIKEGNIQRTPLPDTVVKNKVRLTTYQYTPNGSDKELGGTIGLIDSYLKDGNIYFDENGFAVWKGGTKSKHNGVVYGEKGKDYVIVATATKYLIGQFNYTKNNKITYYNYGDTFQLDITTKNGTKRYRAIVLDSCGASMHWSVTAKGKYAPKTEKQKAYCKETNNTKIDVFTAPKGYSNLENPKDIAYQLKVIKSKKVPIKKLTSKAFHHLKQNYESQNLYSNKINVLK